jgi:hypothetical protein
MCSDGARLQVVVDVGGFRVLLIDAQQKKVDPVKQGLFSIDDRALANLLWAVDVAEKDIAVMLGRVVPSRGRFESQKRCPRARATYRSLNISSILSMSL